MFLEKKRLVAVKLKEVFFCYKNERCEIDRSAFFFKKELLGAVKLTEVS